eukprot:TRINITY_DN10913_c0_g1_i1.p1 TRINITY_DN10913_c0_g1~~TRINITY_DN10913_c0_g1_i1.p1  ORF type:complete len:112 (-),score=11.91 TRINITY_DN10913_c0_g1_i1:202-537(-)
MEEVLEIGADGSFELPAARPVQEPALCQVQRSLVYDARSSVGKPSTVEVRVHAPLGAHLQDAEVALSDKHRLLVRWGKQAGIMLRLPVVQVAKFCAWQHEGVVTVQVTAQE